MTRHLLLLAALVGVLFVAACGEDDSGETAATATSTATAAPSPSATPAKPRVKVPKGDPPKELKIEDLKEGTGPAVKKGDAVSVHYVGVDYKTGKQFDSSYDSGTQFNLTLGAGDVIKGWDQGIEGMKVGGRRQLIIPPDLAYGKEGQPPTIKPNATLVFVIDLVETL